MPDFLASRALDAVCGRPAQFTQVLARKTSRYVGERLISQTEIPSGADLLRRVFVCVRLCDEWTSLLHPSQVGIGGYRIIRAITHDRSVLRCEVATAYI